MTAAIKKEVVRFSVTLGVTVLLLFFSGISGYGPCSPGSVIGALCLYAALSLLLLDAIFFGFVVNAVIRRKEAPIQSPVPTRGNGT